ncbi:MAG: glycosyltransferase [Candidatus Omnitrophica bacterium]|nr:glycosyltransferase [Candidatus Omnitrophota bacterium]
MKTALIHDWLVNRRGAEYILETLCEVFPEADIFTLIYDPEKAPETFKNRAIKTSFISNLPFAKEHFRLYLPLFPKAIEEFDLAAYDLVISINHCIAKGVRIGKGARHICYCLTPMRYVWVYQDEYFGRFRAILSPLINYLKRWDRGRADAVDIFLAISNHIKKRIRRCYDKDSAVIFPPVDMNYFLNGSSSRREDFYLIVSELVPYKRTNLAVEAFNELGLRLIIIGDGPCKKHLVRMAKENITFLDWQPKDKLKAYYSKAKALLYPQKEDFGLVAVEAQAAGCPVIAYRKGGALDTVIENKTGVFFNHRTKESLIDAVRRFDAMQFAHGDIIENAKRFDKVVFKREFKELVDAVR